MGVSPISSTDGNDEDFEQPRVFALVPDGEEVAFAAPGDDERHGTLFLTPRGGARSADFPLRHKATADPSETALCGRISPRRLAEEGKIKR